MIMKPFLSIIIPAHNERANLPELIPAIESTIQPLGVRYEVIVIDDGSTDETWSILQKLGVNSPVIRAMRFSRNFGKEAAIAAGLTNARGDAAIIMDADFQHPPALIADMVAQWRTGKYDVIDTVKTDRGKESLWYRIASGLFYRLIACLSEIDIRQKSDFCLLDRKVITNWLQFKERGLFFRGMSEWMGCRRATLPFAVPQRNAGRTRWTLKKLAEMTISGITCFTSLPLRLVTVIGMLFFIFAIIVGGRIIVVKLTGRVLDGLTTVILLILLSGSMIMIALGIIGEYIARIFNEVKARPRYLVMDEINPVKEMSPPAAE